MYGALFLAEGMPKQKEYLKTDNIQQNNRLSETGDFCRNFR